MMRMVPFFPLAVLSIVGCTPEELKGNTVATSRTWSDIQYQQVADNLAMLSYSPEMLPYFMVIGQGTVAVADSVGLGGELEWAPSAAPRPMLGLDVGREAKMEWELRPVTSPERLVWMRIAYLCALGSEDNYSWHHNPCKAFLEEFEEWYDFTNDEKGGKFGPFEAQLWPVKVPADAIVVGRYRDTVVIVRRDQMRDLRLLTTLIFDYATLKLGVADSKKEGTPAESFYNPNLRGTGG